jgi:hypothetical protein
MTVHAIPRFSTLLAATAALLMACPAAAQMTPIQDLCRVEAHAHYNGVDDSKIEYSPAPFAKFETFITAYAEVFDVGHAEATSFISSEFFPAGIFGSGATGGHWGIPPSGSNSAVSRTYYRFSTSYCIQYSLDATVDPGDGPAGYIEVRNAFGSLVYEHVDSGHHSLSGRLSPGEYVIEGISSFNSPLSDYTAPTYAIIWTCAACTGPIIAVQPADVNINCGNTATFTVVPTAPAAGTTYQWRRNGVPLTNNGHIMGATTATLTINNVCDPDADYYDVVVTRAGVVEPSRLAHLGTGGTTDVPPGLSLGFTLNAPTPNPFQGSTSFPYALTGTQHATAAIYDALGRKVRTIASRELSGAGALTWDGRSESGSPAPRGLYFLKVDVAGQTHVRRCVRIQ